MDARIALLPGDGIGPEVIDAAALVLSAAADRFGHTFSLRAWPIGGAAIRRGLPALPLETREGCAHADALLLGAVGDPKFDDLEPDERPEAALLALRRQLDAFANLRPARAIPGLEHLCPLKPDIVAGADVLIIRELTGGLYFGEPRGWDRASGVAVNTLRYSEREVERIAIVAFQAALGRRRLVTSVDKANVLETSRLWRAAVQRVAERFPDVRLKHMYVDACAMRLMFEPRAFDVILTENMFGDILSDQAAAISGSIGLMPSASIGAGIGLFEPVHGSAPTLAGRDAANPLGAIGSAAMLLGYGLNLEREAQAVELAIEATLRSGMRTADMLPANSRDRAAGCAEIGRAVAQAVREANEQNRATNQNRVSSSPIT